MKLNEWIDKVTGETKQGLSITANNVLSPYDIKKRKPKPATHNDNTKPETLNKVTESHPFDDDIVF